MIKLGHLLYVAALVHLGPTKCGCPIVICLSVRAVRKKWLSLYYSTCECYIYQTYTNWSSWHDLLMPSGCLCPWPIFRAWVKMVRKKWLYSTQRCYIHETYTICTSWHYLLMSLNGLCPWPTFHASVTKTQNGNSGAPVMAPITIMSSSF